MPVKTEENSIVPGEEMTSSLEMEMTSLTIQLLSLTQDLVTTKLRMEASAKTGWILLAKARYVSPGGPSSISKLQLPSIDSEKEVTATKRILTEECMQGNTKVRYFHHSFEEKSEAPESGVKQRKTAEKKEATEDNKPVSKQQLDPLKWFGVLTPTALKQSQAHFVTATEVALECANIQSEMAGVQNRIKYIQRVKQKAEKEKGDSIENLDSKFQSNLTLVN
eukprot:GFUD01035099.1.p1 GENE.GFUD01035099.1~~GFUD01035099.1.p1  ORF type:complete len:222 (+),score=91.15 GFUD01035099.1:78-743(+)